MKFILTLAFNCLIYTAFAQWNYDNQSIIYSTNGNVGIGIDAPLEKLHINGNVRGNSAGGSIRINTTYGWLDLGAMNSSWAHLQTDRAKFYFNKSVFVDGALSSYNANDLELQTNGTTRITALNANGYVGIGTASPQGRFQVNQIRPVIIKDNGGQGVYGSEIGFNAVLNTIVTPNQFRKLGGTNQKGGASIAVDYYGTMLFQMYNADTENESIINYSPQVVFKYNGNVGIGTQSPDAKLTVNGTIHSEEVKVDLNVPGPDYVFEKDYKLPSLPEVEEYISSHKHLSEIPSAEEMKQNGINLSEMNLLLLKKVEELTLYAVEQNKISQEQAGEIETLKEELEKIKSKYRAGRH